MNGLISITRGRIKSKSYCDKLRQTSYRDNKVCDLHPYCITIQNEGILSVYSIVNLFVSAVNGQTAKQSIPVLMYTLYYILGES